MPHFLPNERKNMERIRQLELMKSRIKGKRILLLSNKDVELLKTAIEDSIMEEQRMEEMAKEYERNKELMKYEEYSGLWV